jgi:hypothetical protein
MLWEGLTSPHLDLQKYKSSTPVEANSTGGQGSRRAVAPIDDDDDDDDDASVRLFWMR